MASDYTVGDMVAEFLSACGVTTAFGIASVHNIPMLDAIGRRNTIRFMMARGELGGAHMADGYARASGGLGVIFSSTGPGAANAVGGLIEARFAGSPVLHITGHTATKFADRELGTVHDPYDQLGMLRSVSKSAYRVRSAQQAFGVLTRAAVDALSAPTGPVSVEVPIDLQREKIERPAVLDNFVLPLPAARTPSDTELDELAVRVAQAKRPLLWLGRGATKAGAAVSKLLDLGFCTVSSFNGRGTVAEDDPRSLGGLTGTGVPVIPIPGANAALSALVASGLSTDEFHFIGFLPEKAGARRTRLEALAAEVQKNEAARTLVFYEAPHRILETLTDLESVFGPALRVVVARELTKIHEEFLRGTVAEARQELAGRDRIRGEITLLVDAQPRAQGQVAGSVTEKIADRVARLQNESGVDEKEALKRIARELGQSKSDVYRELQRERAKRR